MRRTTQSDSMNDSSLLRSIRSDARSLARHIATRSRARRVRTSRTTRTNFTNRELHGLHRRTSRVIRRFHDRSLTVVGKTKQSARADARAKTRLAPRCRPPRPRRGGRRFFASLFAPMRVRLISMDSVAIALGRMGITSIEPRRALAAVATRAGRRARAWHPSRARRLDRPWMSFRKRYTVTF